MKKNKVIFISLNELNFDKIDKYLSSKKFSSIKEIKKNLSTTSSEIDYKKLEPWIQWVSIYFGLKAEEHKVVRLGEEMKFNFENIFQTLEKRGYKIGAISPMNIFNNLKNPSYFIPDPWTKTKADNNYWSKLLHDSVSVLVKDNARKKINFKSYFCFLLAFIKYARISNYYLFIKMFIKGFKNKWFKALFLDLFLHDFHLKKLKENSAEFSNIFFNSLAHIQHHYFFNSFDSLELKNPKWYINGNKDPLLDGLEVFERILSDYLKLSKEYKIIISTGLTQVPYDMVKYYYRLKNHKEFFISLGINIEEVQELMSRDFIIKFNLESSAKKALEVIRKLKTSDNEKLFSDITLKNCEIFLTLSVNKEINTQGVIYNDRLIIKNLKQFVDFVAIKNGMHDGKGFLYFSDRKLNEGFEIHNLKNKIEKIIFDEKI